MIENNSSHRIVFIDILRLFAIIMMIQGHSLDVFLRYDLKLPNSVEFGTYTFIRGLTAPLFLFCSGFIYGFRFSKTDNETKFRKLLKKTFLRGIVLIIVGYLAKSPTASPFHLDHITDDLIKLFLAVDILQLIGMAVLIFALLEYISRKFNINIYHLLLTASISGVLFFSVSAVINWEESFPLIISSWFSVKTGSLFPLFPWISYLLFGAFWGEYFHKTKLYLQDNLIAEKLMILSILFVGIAYFNDWLEQIITADTTFWTTGPHIIMIRVGAVLLLCSTAVLASCYIKKFPKPLMNLSRNSLWVYILHIAILYGSSWNTGIKDYYGNTFSFAESMIGVVLILISMLIFSEIISYFKSMLKNIYRNFSSIG